MNYFLAFLIFLFCFPVFSQGFPLEEWDAQAKTNKRLLPKYGNLPKSEAEKDADKQFIQSMLARDSSRRMGSNEMIKLGFNYMYKGELKIAMYRFNQAYLMDSTNTDIYWGYGAVYMTLGAFERAKMQYEKGLSLEPSNSHLLTDYATYFMVRYYATHPVDPKEGMRNLDSALTYLHKSYLINSKDPNTTFKLSACYLNKSDCDNAWKYYKECKLLGGQPITEEFSKDLKKNCKPKK